MKKTCETCEYLYHRYDKGWIIQPMIGGRILGTIRTELVPIYKCFRYPKTEDITLDYGCGEWSRKEEESDDE